MTKEDGTELGITPDEAELVRHALEQIQVQHLRELSSASENIRVRGHGYKSPLETNEVVINKAIISDGIRRSQEMPTLPPSVPDDT